MKFTLIILLIISASIPSFSSEWLAYSSPDPASTADTNKIIDYTWEADGNPIIKHIRSADPSCHVWNDGKLWVYASHDQDYATDYSSMDGYHVFSTNDLKTWTDHGEILHSKDVSWGIEEGGWMWAPDCAYKNGKYYLYFPHKNVNGSWRIGVAVSDYPEGPFTDIGQPIEGTSGTDPMCFVDDDGEAYLYFGSRKVAKLKENMIELAESPRNVNYGASNFGEGAWMHKRNGIYYYSYTEFSNPTYQGFYSMGDSPYGPFEYKGEVGKRPTGAQDHHSIFEYRGKWYYFYHVGNYNGGSGNRRNVCGDYLYYNEDGTIKLVVHTTEGVAPDSVGLATGIEIPGEFSPDVYYTQQGTEVNGSDVVNINNGDFLEYVLDINYPYTFNLEITPGAVYQDAEIELLVDNQPVKMLPILTGQALISNSLFLYNGRHTFRLQFSSAMQDNIIDLARIKISSDTIHYKITAERSPGGRISPQGEIYYKASSSVVYSIIPDKEYLINDVRVNSQSEGIIEEYTFTNLQSDQHIFASFEPCQTEVEIWVQINTGPEELISRAEALPGDTLHILPTSPVTGLWQWSGPGGYSSDQQNITLHIAPATIGKYSLEFTNESGCRSDYALDVIAIRDIIEAESFSSQEGIKTEGTSDEWGGQNIGFIDNGDWAEYIVNPEKPGLYQVSYRVANPGNNVEIEFYAKQQIKGSTSLPVSGGWQTWITTEPDEIILEKGMQPIRLVFKGGSGYLFNLNWFKLEFIREIDLTPPVWLFTSVGALTIGADIIVMIDEPGTVYLVPAGTAADTTAIFNAALYDIFIQQYTEGVIPSSDQEAGDYILYAIDDARNISEASRVITLEAEAVDTTAILMHELKIAIQASNQSISIVSPNEIKLVNIFNLLGKKIDTIQGKGTELVIRTNTLKKGIYFLQVVDTFNNSNTAEIFL